jgi:hypothetical protein
MCGVHHLPGACVCVKHDNRYDYEDTAKPPPGPPPPPRCVRTATACVGRLATVLMCASYVRGLSGLASGGFWRGLAECTRTATHAQRPREGESDTETERSRSPSGCATSSMCVLLYSAPQLRRLRWAARAALHHGRRRRRRWSPHDWIMNDGCTRRIASCLLRLLPACELASAGAARPMLATG